MGDDGTHESTATETWSPDVLGDGWVARTLPLAPDAEGEVVATLVRPAPAPTSRRAILYLHGFVDYFFQTHLADEAAAHGYDFYALDLRKHGRSLRPHQTPNYITELADYAEELDLAAGIIRSEEGHTELVVLGHSTGGLVACLWAEARGRDGRPVVDALVLNSPWLDLNESWFYRRVLTPVLDRVGAVAPLLTVGSVQPHYGTALHSGSGGEWTYDLTWKPHEGFPARAGWFRTIRRGHARVARGLDVRCPVLVLASASSGDSKAWHDALLTTDSVLDVEQIVALAPGLGRDVTVVQIPGGAHDLALSPEPARSAFFAEAFGWLAGRQA